MKLTVLGAGGLLGRHVVEEATLAGLTVRGFDRRACDVADAAAVARAVAGADVVVNCAAFTNVDGAEADEAGAWRGNALGAENVARAVAAERGKLVHVSTDFVFDGAQTEPYDEFARANPQSIYARSKYGGEVLAERALGELFICRVQGLYGRGGGNFSSKLRQLILDGKALKLDGERRVQPTWARVAALQLVSLAAGREFGLYHVSCKGETTWAGFCERLAAQLSVEPKWTVVTTADLKAPAVRPVNCLFRQRMLELRGLDLMPTWQEAQDQYLDEEKSA